MWFVSCGVFGNSQAFNEFNGKDRELFGNKQEKMAENSEECMKWRVECMK